MPDSTSLNPDADPTGNALRELLRQHRIEVLSDSDGTIWGVNFEHTHVNDARFALLRQMPHLTHLNLKNSRNTDYWLSQVRYLRQGSELLSGLHELCLMNSQLTDAGCEAVGSLSSLEALWLNHTPVTDEGIRYLAGLGRLQKLGLGFTGISGKALQELVTLAALQELYLDKTTVDDGSLEHLTRLPNLRLLSLYMTPITNDGLAKLAGLVNLQRLHLEGVRGITAERIASLRTALPQCDIRT